MPSAQDALNYARRFVGNVPLDDTPLKLRVLNDAHAKLWMAAPWRWTVGALSPVQMVNNTQTYTFSAVAGLAYVVSASMIVSGEERYDVQVAAVLPTTTQIKGRVAQMEYTKGTPNDSIKVLPVPTGFTTGPYLLGVYKKEPVAITDSGGSPNIATDFTQLTGLPAYWFWVFQEIVLAKAMAFVQSPRLGSVTTVDGKTQYTGQLGVVEAAIADMRDAEKKFFDSQGVVVNG